MHTPAFQVFRHTLAATALAVVLTQSSAQTTRADETGVALYVQQIKPALEKHCAMCHDGQSRKGGLDVTSREALLRGGTSGPAILSGNAKDSLLYKLIAHKQEPGMPYKTGKLPDWARSDTTVSRRGLKVGVLGLCYRFTPTVTLAKNVTQLEFLDDSTVAAGLGELEDALVASVRLARAEPERLAHEASERYGYPAGFLARYFEKLRYRFGPRERAGLMTFLELAHEAGELEEVPELRFVREAVVA